ncbi:MAG TPA: helix-turn-helix transcriptional regulator [Candidatus Fimimorpha excrementavium]|nr:helix-turn-helix transcriptional regulator [Candidatus Fimimorpha excrementavium]
MKTRKLTLFQQALTAYNVNNVILYNDYSNIAKTDYGFRLRLYEGNAYQQMLLLITQLVTPSSMLRFTDEFDMTYFYLHIPKAHLNEYESSFFVIGPFFEKVPDEAAIRRIMLKNKIPPSLTDDIEAVYSSIPDIQALDRFESLVLNLASGLFETSYNVSYYPDHSSISIERSPFLGKMRQNPKLAVASIEERYWVESQMLEAVSKGDYKHAKELHQKFGSFHIQPRTENLLRNTQNFQIILNTLCRKAAELGGVHPLYIDDLSTKFAVLINEARTQRELTGIANDIIHKYCLLVQNHAMKGYSPVIKDIISYIDFHYAEDLSLSFFADQFNLTKTYLSGLFKKEVKITLTDYIHQIRIRRAITLINSSSLSISTIASACGYQDINYFIRVFKKMNGVSPKQYQKMILHS